MTRKIFNNPRTVIVLVISIMISLASMNAIACEFKSGKVKTALLELYTSEGCSSCPPADNWLSTLTKSKALWKKVIPVAFHVDYWDYIGWKDRFARPAYNKRQYNYRRHSFARSVYTPGFFVNGREWRQWFTSRKLSLPLESSAGMLRAMVANGVIEIMYKHKSLPSDLVANIAYLGFDINNRIKSGENAGRNLKHNFVVLGFQQIDSSTKPGTWKTRIKPVAGMDKPRAVAVWVTRKNDPTPLQAVGGWCNLGVSSQTIGLKIK